MRLLNNSIWVALKSTQCGSVVEISGCPIQTHTHTSMLPPLLLRPQPPSTNYSASTHTHTHRRQNHPIPIPLAYQFLLMHRRKHCNRVGIITTIPQNSRSVHFDFGSQSVNSFGAHIEFINLQLACCFFSLGMQFK